MPFGNLPTELLSEMVSHLGAADLRNLRLVNKKLSAIASRLVMKRITFAMCKQDFDMLLSIADHPVYSEYVSTLVYNADVMRLDRANLALFRANIQNTSRIDKKLNLQALEVSDDIIEERYRQYNRLFDEQQDILANNTNFAVLKHAVSKFSNLREIVVCCGGEMGSHRRADRVLLYSYQLTSEGMTDGTGAARHLESLLQAVEAADTKLDRVRAGKMHVSFFDPLRFELQSLEFLSNVTIFDIVIQVIQPPPGLYSDEPSMNTVQKQIRDCRKVMAKGTLRRVLDSMPHLVSLRLIVEEDHSFDYDAFRGPVLWDHIMPEGKVWPRLKNFSLGDIETDRDQLVAFLVKHKDTLVTLEMEYMRLKSTSWMKLLPQLRKGFRGSPAKKIVFSRVLIGASEDDGHPPEQWLLGNPDIDREPHPLEVRINEYLNCSGPKKGCPLRVDNMWGYDEDDWSDVHGSDGDNQDSAVDGDDNGDWISHFDGEDEDEDVA
ncbi:hypothetical protein OQA88_12735 [Cercophora sp. LCS_1]